MENFDTNAQPTRKSSDKFELKDYIQGDQVKVILREWLNALEEDRDLEVTIKGENCKIPKEAFRMARTKAEYEIKNGEYEFELEMKWRPSQLS